MTHRFTETKIDPISKKEYKKCIYCGKVMLLDNSDPYFNLFCIEASKRNRDIRNRLEEVE